MQKETRHTAVKGAVRLTLILLGGIALGFGLLVAAFCLPVEPMAQNVRLSIPTLDGTWGSGEEAAEQVVKGYQTMQLDNATDASMLLTAIHQSDTGAVDRAINVYTYRHEVYYTQYGTLMQYGQTGLEDMNDTATTRYWLGYLIVLKPLLLFMTYMDIRVLNMLLQGLMLAGILMLMQQRGLGRYGLPFALAMCAVTPAITGLSLQFSTALWVMGLAMLVLLWKPDWVRHGVGDAAFFLVTGMATSYFDYLTYPLLTFGMPFVLWLLMNEDDSNRAVWKRLLRCGMAWCAGYAGMWVGKWAIAALAGNEDFWSSVVGSIETRTSAELRDAAITRWDALLATLKVYAKKPYLLLGVATAIGYGAALWRSRRRKTTGCRALYGALLAVATLPLIWFLLMANHTYIHAYFTCRALAVTAFGLLCAMSRRVGADA